LQHLRSQILFGLSFPSRSHHLGLSGSMLALVLRHTRLPSIVHGRFFVRLPKPRFCSKGGEVHFAEPRSLPGGGTTNPPDPQFAGCDQLRLQHLHSLALFGLSFPSRSRHLSLSGSMLEPLRTPSGQSSLPICGPRLHTVSHTRIFRRPLRFFSSAAHLR